MYRVIEPRDRTPAQLKNGVCQRSTELYPSWVLASAPAAPPEITKAVVYAAFSMAPTGDGHYWTVGTDYRAVDELYRSLRPMSGCATGRLAAYGMSTATLSSRFLFFYWLG